MAPPQPNKMLTEFYDGRSELVFDLLSAGYSADFKDENGVSLIQHCAYYGDVSAIRFLLSRGELLESMGENFGLNAASFHGHWRLCKFLWSRVRRSTKPWRARARPHCTPHFARQTALYTTAFWSCSCRMEQIRMP